MDWKEIGFELRFWALPEFMLFGGFVLVFPIPPQTSWFLSPVGIHEAFMIGLICAMQFIIGLLFWLTEARTPLRASSLRDRNRKKNGE